jgi:hypothetical protein
MTFIQKRLALVGEESVSVVTRGSRYRVNQENPPMRTYIIGNDGIRLRREAPSSAAFIQSPCTLRDRFVDDSALEERRFRTARPSSEGVGFVRMERNGG